MKIILTLNRMILDGLAEDLKNRHGVDYDDRIKEILQDYYSGVKQK